MAIGADLHHFIRNPNTNRGNKIKREYIEYIDIGLFHHYSFQVCILFLRMHERLFIDIKKYFESALKFCIELRASKYANFIATKILLVRKIMF